jgi:L-galactose dehydrogenase
LRITSLSLWQESEGILAVREAVKSGINFFDVAPYYGRTKAEIVLGRGLRDLPRDSYVLGTKVGRYDRSAFDFGAERVVSSVEESLKRLGVEYLDVVHCHDIEFGDLDLVVGETIPALLRLKEAGKIRAIGITGYPLEIFPYVLSCVAPKSVDVVLSYCNYTLQNDRLAVLSKSLRQKFGVGVINASPLCMGLLTDGGCPPWHPAGVAVKQAAIAANEVCKARGDGSTLASVALQYALGASEDMVATTLVGIESRARLRSNIAIMESSTDAGLLEQVRASFNDVRNETWASGRYLGKPARKSQPE